MLLLRMAAGAAVLAQAFAGHPIEIPPGPLSRLLLAAAGGSLLMAGLWTPIGGSLVAIWGLWNAIARPGEPWSNILLGAIGAALALLGPGAWSIDARLFGWRRVYLHDRGGRL